MLGNDVTETTYFRNLFLHIGYESSSLSRWVKYPNSAMIRTNIVTCP
jgi:hypothetical protein